MGRKRDEYEYRGLIGLVLAGSLALFLFGFAIFAAVEAWHDPTGRGALSENATQILGTVAGGIIGVLAGYIGGIEAAAARRDTPTDPQSPADDTPTPYDPDRDATDTDETHGT